jgi:hypothetical protein
VSAGPEARAGATDAAAPGAAPAPMRVGLMVPANNTTMARELPA